MIDNREQLSRSTARAHVLDAIEAGIAAGDPQRAVTASIRLADSQLYVDETAYDLTTIDRIIVVGAGKAAGRQAQAVEAILGDMITDGKVITTESVSCDQIAISIGDHPVPTERNVDATNDILELLTRVDDRTIVLALISGGGSALLTAPAGNLTLDHLQTVTHQLLTSGATISEINAVRTHLSAVKGGKLASQAAPATVITLAMSDVVGDEPSIIASGPTVSTEATAADARSVLQRYDIQLPDEVDEHLSELEHSEGQTGSGVGDADYYVIANANTALDAARETLDAAGYKTLILSSRFGGEARDLARFHTAIAAEIEATGSPLSPPAALLSGGEATVTVTGTGQGGANQEFVLSAAIDLPRGTTVGAVDTDGIDGDSPAAGAVADCDTVTDSTAATAALANNDVYTFFDDMSEVIETGYTGTNLNDLRIIVVEDTG